MPRVTLRTVEPAKELACQSVEKRCTRTNASCATSDMIRSVNGTIACRPISRSTIEPRPNATMATVAVIHGCFSQCRVTKGITTRIAAGLLRRAVMASSGSRSRAGRRLHFWTRARPEGKTQASIRIIDLRRFLQIGTVARSGLAEAASSEAGYSIRHERRTRTGDLRKCDNHANPPTGSSDEAPLIDASALICKLAHLTSVCFHSDRRH